MSGTIKMDILDKDINTITLDEAVVCYRDNMFSDNAERYGVILDTLVDRLVDQTVEKNIKKIQDAIRVKLLSECELFTKYKFFYDCNCKIHTDLLTSINNYFRRIDGVYDRNMVEKYCPRPVTVDTSVSTPRLISAGTRVSVNNYMEERNIMTKEIQLICDRVKATKIEQRPLTALEERLLTTYNQENGTSNNSQKYGVPLSSSRKSTYATNNATNSYGLAPTGYKPDIGRDGVNLDELLKTAIKPVSETINPNPNPTQVTGNVPVNNTPTPLPTLTPRQSAEQMVKQMVGYTDVEPKDTSSSKPIHGIEIN